MVVVGVLSKNNYYNLFLNLNYRRTIAQQAQRIYAARTHAQKKITRPPHTHTQRAAPTQSHTGTRYIAHTLVVCRKSKRHELAHAPRPRSLLLPSAPSHARVRARRAATSDKHEIWRALELKLCVALESLVNTCVVCQGRQYSV